MARNTAANWASYGLAVLIALVLTPLIIRSVGTPAYGLWILFTQLTGYAGLLDLGVQTALVRHLARARARSDRDESERLLGTALLFGLAAGLLVAAAAWVVSLRIEAWFHLGALPAPAARAALRLVGLGAGVGLPASALGAALKGHHRFDLAAAVGIASQLTRGAGTLLVVWMGAGLEGLAWAFLAGNAVALACGLLLLGRAAGQPPLLRFSPAALRVLASFGLYSLIGTLGWSLAYGSDAVIIAALLTASDVAHFGLAANVLVVLSGVVGGFTSTLLPLASEAQARGDDEANPRHYLLATRLALVMALPVIAALALLGPPLLSAWVGSSFGRPSGQLLQVLALAHLPVTANAAAIPIALGVGRHKAAAGLALAEGLANLALSYALALRLGVLGVALGTLLPSLVVHGVLWPRLLRRSLGLSAARVWKEAVRPALLPLPAAGLALLLGVGRSGTAALAATLLALAAYWALAARLALTPGERAGLLAWAGR